MGRKASSARVAAAMKAGDPPSSADYSDDDKWHDAQDAWIADFQHTSWPARDDRRRRDAWKAATKHYWRAKPAVPASVAPLATPRHRPQQNQAPQLRSSRVLAGPPEMPRPTPQPGESQEEYELAMGEYAIVRDARRALPRRTRAENAERMRVSREATAEAARGSDEEAAAANVRMDRERERSQQRRAAAAADASEQAKVAARQERREEQSALVAEIDKAVSRAEQLHAEPKWSGGSYFDEPLCRALQAWVAEHSVPDGTDQWEDAFMAVAISSATLRFSGSTPASMCRKVGALATLRWLLPTLSFRARPGALDPDPLMTVEQRAAKGYCVCGCKIWVSHEVPLCQVHQVRRGPIPLPASAARRVNQQVYLGQASLQLGVECL